MAGRDQASSHTRNQRPPAHTDRTLPAPQGEACSLRDSSDWPYAEGISFLEGDSAQAYHMEVQDREAWL